MVEVLTVDEVARELKVSRRTVERWVASGIIPKVTLPGRVVRIRRRDVDALLDGAPLGWPGR